VAALLERGEMNMDWQKLLISWEGNLFWAVLGIICGWLVARHYYRKTGDDIRELKAEILEKIDITAVISKEQKEALKADMAGIFYTQPWEKDYGLKTLGGGGRGRQKLGE
jgi:hypothetical protein